jgi:hypothetical protein
MHTNHKKTLHLLGVPRLVKPVYWRLHLVYGAADLQRQRSRQDTTRVSSSQGVTLQGPVALISM